MHALRRWITARATDAALAAAPRLSDSLIAAIEMSIATTGPWMPVLGRMVADNLRAAALYSPLVHRRYFARVAAHLADALQLFRAARAIDRGNPTDVRSLIDRRVTLDGSAAAVLERGLAVGRGAIVMAHHHPHFLLTLARFNDLAPVTVFLRRSRDAGKQGAKQAWCHATGLRWIAERPRTDAPLYRFSRMADALRGGGVLFISPDLPQKRGHGVAVSFLGRQVCLPPGAAMLAVRTRAALFTLAVQPDRDALRVSLRPSGVVDAAARGRDERRDLLRQMLQIFADQATQTIRAHPELWYLWGDKRWTHVFRDDPRYVPPSAGRLDAPTPAEAASPIAPAGTT